MGNVMGKRANPYLLTAKSALAAGFFGTVKTCWVARPCGYAQRVALACLLFGCVLSLHAGSRTDGSYFLRLSPPVLLASDDVTAANTALINGQYKTVEKLVGKVISQGKQKPEVMAKALLLRGIAFRNQGKIARAIADFSNAEWLQKLRGVELRRLYAERALAYEAAGQKTLADKDRQLAGASSLQNAKRLSEKSGVTINSQGVKKTSVTGNPSVTNQLFGGLGNLFGFNANSEKKEVTVKQVETNKVAVVQNAPIREIPTLDSIEAKANRAKLDGKAETPLEKAPGNKKVADPAVKTYGKDITPSNSAWAAQRIEADKKAANHAQKEREATQKYAKKKGAIDWEAFSQKASSDGSKNKTPSGVNDQPVALNPGAGKQQDGQNPITDFFGNIFGTPQKKVADAPVQPGEEVVSEDQIASLDNNAIAGKVKKNPPKQLSKPPAKQQLRKPPPRRVAAVQKAKKKPKPPVRAQSRSLYHIQLGAFGEAQAADKFVSRLNKKYKSLIGSKTAMVVETDLGNARRQYRVYLGPFRSRDKGVKSCKTLRSLGMGCSLVE